MNPDENDLNVKILTDFSVPCSVKVRFIAFKL